VTGHQEIRKLLAQSAAGLLEAEEERRVREHLRDCAECAARAEEFAGLASGLGALPAPPLPLGLVTRTEALVAAELAAEADRRQGAMLAAVASMLAWLMAVAGWYLYRALTSGGIWGWVALSTIPVSVAIPAAAAIVRRNRLERRML